MVLWEELLADHEGAELRFEQVPFDHPLWVLYSSGTTGLPKALVHGHGGVLLEHLKKLSLHMDVKPGDPFFWFTTTGWMMWNVVASSLLVGGTALLYDGSPGHPNMNVLWEFAEKTGMTCFGTSASYLTGCKDAGLEPGKDYDLSTLRAIGSTGSPLPPEGFEWVYEHVKDLWLFSTSGGTDLCTAFVGGVPLLPVHTGELQCRSLGASVHAFGEEGLPVVEEVGELVITEPMPSMPLFLWGDESGERYEGSYFGMYPGVWRHGDWIKITERGSAVIYGRSDSTINRGGIRMGTAEIYRAVNEVLPSSGQPRRRRTQRRGRVGNAALRRLRRKRTELTDDLKKEISTSIRENCSPRHVPNYIYEIEEIPQTLNGKKLEVPVKKILAGESYQRERRKQGLSEQPRITRLLRRAGWKALACTKP